MKEMVKYMNNNMNTSEGFNNRIHLIGRLTVAMCLICFIMLPILLSWIYKAPIDFGNTLEKGFSILIMFTFSAICENVSYTPVIGAGALYTSCVTGDVSNMKVPAAINAMKVANVEPGTEKGDIVSILASSTCTYVTTGIAFMGMLFLSPIIKPIYEHPALNPAFTYMVPAIFGTLLVPTIVKRPKESLPILIVPVILIFTIGRAKFSGIQSYLMLIMAVISVAYSYQINKRKILEAQKKEGIQAEESEGMEEFEGYE
jgi:hypothetical protein